MINKTKSVKKEEIDPLDGVEEESVINYNRPAFTIFKDHDRNVWCVGQINFDPGSQMVDQSMKIIEEEPNKELIVERFKIRVAKELING